MKVRESKKEYFRGEIVVFLSYVIILLVAFITSLIAAARIQVSKNEGRADIDRAMECVFAEYQKELFETYDIFAIEGSYETGTYSEEAVLERLEYFSDVDGSEQMERIQLLTDDNCAPLLEQMVKWATHKYGLDKVSEYIGKSTVFKGQEEGITDYETKQADSDSTLTSLLSEGGETLPTQDNPIQVADGLKSRPLLEMIKSSDFTISEKSIHLQDTVSKRCRNAGYGDFSDQEESIGTGSTLLLGEYLLAHFSSAVDEVEDAALDYQLEYLIAGKSSDAANLEAVAKKLLLMRLVANFGYIQTDTEKVAEAEACAATLCTLLTVPGITEVAKQGILLAWAYGESIMDLRSLLAGNKVALVKTKESWQLSLSGLLKMESDENFSDGKDADEGIGYEEYLRMLLLLEDKGQIGFRSADIMETSLQTQGLDFFKMDDCICRMEVKSICRLERGITYQFSTYYGYR